MNDGSGYGGACGADATETLKNIAEGGLGGYSNGGIYSDQGVASATVAVQSFPSPRLPDDHAGSIVFSVGNKEVLRIDPGSPPRVTVAEGVEASEGAMAVLCALASMIERYYPNWK